MEVEIELSHGVLATPSTNLLRTTLVYQWEQPVESNELVWVDDSK